MNNYLLEGNDTFVLELEREKIIKENKFKNAAIYKYDLEESELEKVLEDLDTYGFLTEKKVIIVKNIESLKYDEYKKDFDHLYKYLENPNLDNLLIIETKKIGNSKVLKELKNKCEFIEVDLDSKKYIKNILKDYNILDEAVSLLDKYCLSDISKIDSECQKLKNFKLEEKEITIDDIKELVVIKIGDPKDLTFSFTRSLAMRDRKAALSKYRELLSYDIEPIGIIGLLASQIRIIYQTKLLEKDHLSDREMANILEEKSDYRVSKARELTRLYSEDDLLKLMEELAKIDLTIKTTDVDPNSLIEMFIINI